VARLEAVAKVWPPSAAGAGRHPAFRPDRCQHAAVLDPVKAWPGNGRVCGTVARRPALTGSVRGGMSLARVGTEGWRRRGSNQRMGPGEVEPPERRLLPYRCSEGRLKDTGLSARRNLVHHDADT